MFPHAPCCSRGHFIFCVYFFLAPTATKQKKATVIKPGGSFAPSPGFYIPGAEGADESSTPVPEARKDRAVSLPKSTPRRSSRHKNKNVPKENEVIELLSDGDESESGLVSSQADRSNVSNTPNPSIRQHVVNGIVSLTSSLLSHLQTPTKPLPTRRKHLRLDVSRIAIGKKVFYSESEVVFKKGVLKLYDKSKHRNPLYIAQIDFPRDECKLFRYFLTDDCDDSPVGSFVALKVKPTKDNNLSQYHNAYQMNSGEDLKSYVVVEFHSSKDLEEMMDMMADLPAWAPFTENSELDPAEKSAFCVALSAARGKQRRGTAKVTDAFVDNRDEDTVLLVYPFAGDTLAMENAAEGLPEASGTLFATGETEATEMEPTDRDGDISSEPSGSDGAVVVKTEHRRHFLTIQVRDFERLCPGEFLNDTLIDFWIQW